MNRYLSKLRAVAGFTMIELLVVISVIGVLAVAVLSSINPIEQINKGRDVRANSDAAQLVNAIDRYYATQEKYPWNESAYCNDGTTDTCAVADGGGVGTDTYNLPSSAFPGPAAGGGASNIACPSTLINLSAGGSGTGYGVGVGMCKIGDGALPATVGDIGNSAWLTALSTGSNEVKDSFVSRLRATATSQQPMFVVKPNGAQAIVSVCFKPISTGFKKDALDTCIKYKSGTAIDSTLGLPANACPMPDYTGLTVTSANVGSELICLPFGKAK